MAIAQSSPYLISEETPTSESPPSSSPRPEIPFGGLRDLARLRISEHLFETGHYPLYVVMSPEMWTRLRSEVQWLDYLTPGRWAEEWEPGVQGFVILDFGDEIITADRDEAHVQ